MGKVKQCRACKVIKPLAEYYNMASQEDGKHYYCKGCCKVKRGAERVRKRDKTSKISVRQRIRAEYEGAETEHISLAKLYERDGGICALCGKAVNTRHASPDHIVPLSKGGSHTWENVQLTHLKCNQKKSNKIIRSGHTK